MAERSSELVAMKTALSDKEFVILQSEIERREKSVGLTYALWFFLGYLGIHKFYLGKIWQGLLYIVGPAVAIFFLFAGFMTSLANEELSGGEFSIVIGLMGLITYGIWWLVDLFTIPGQVNTCNEDIEIETIRSVKIHGRQ